MPDGPADPPLPEHPELREFARAMEGAGVSGDIVDERWRTVFISSELARLAGVAPGDVSRYYGKSMIRRHHEDPETWAVTDESGVTWWRQIVPIMRHYLRPEDPDYEAVFAQLGDAATRVTPVAVAPRAWQQSYEFRPQNAFGRSLRSEMRFIEWRVSDDSGTFIGAVRLVRATLPDSLLSRLGRGDPRLFERMGRVSEPGRRSASILFADLEASGALSRRLSSRGYFDLISQATGLDPDAVAYTPLGELDGVSDKAVRDAGTIPVTNI